MDEVIAGIGRKIKALRTGQGLSLQQLATRSGVSAAAIHKVENNSMVPTIAVLMKIAHALDQSVGSLVEERGSAATVTRADERASERNDATTIERVSAGHGHDLDGRVVTLQADQRSVEFQPHAGEELLLVLSGTVEIELDQTYLLHTGDALHLVPGASSRGQRWHNTGKDSAQVLRVRLDR